MVEITDEMMQQRIAATKSYSVVILRSGPQRNMEGADKIIWEHGRKNFVLREAGLLSIVCPIRDGSGVAGIGIFNAGVERVQQLMEEDPAVQAGVLVYEVHACRGFPGDCLPE